MSKLIEQGGKAYRMRRGKLVEIPAEWVGQTVHPQGIRKRPSKLPRKQRMARNVTGWPYPHSYPKRRVPGGHPRGAAPRHVGTKAAEKLMLEGTRPRCTGVVAGRCPVPAARCHQGCAYANDAGEPTFVEVKR